MTNQTQSTAHETQPELKVERTNYGWRVQLPRHPTDNLTVAYEAQRFSSHPYGEMNLMKIVHTTIGKGYFFDYEQYGKISRNWCSILGGASITAMIELGKSPDEKTVACKHHLEQNFKPETLEARAFDLLLETE